MSLAKQVEYRAISERIAYDNPRVVSFSQYLLRDSDPDPPGPSQYGGFESGLRFADGKPKPSLPAFRLPLAVRRDGIEGLGVGPRAADPRHGDDGDRDVREQGLLAVLAAALGEDERVRLLLVHDVVARRAALERDVAGQDGLARRLVRPLRARARDEHERVPGPAHAGRRAEAIQRAHRALGAARQPPPRVGHGVQLGLQPGRPRRVDEAPR